MIRSVSAMFIIAISFDYFDVAGQDISGESLYRNNVIFNSAFIRPSLYDTSYDIYEGVQEKKREKYSLYYRTQIYYHISTTICST